MAVTQGFEEMIRVHLGLIRQIARRYAGDNSAEDLAREILIRLWRAYPRFRGEAKVDTWVYRVALNTAMTHVRDAMRDRRLLAAILAMSIPDEAAPAAVEDDDLVAGFLGVLG